MLILCCFDVNLYSSAKLAKKMEKGKGMHKKIEKKEEKILLFDKIKGNIGVGTVLKRIYNGITMDLLLTNKTEFPAYNFFGYFVWSNPRLPVFSHLKIAIETRGFRQAICMQIQELLISMHFCNQQRK